jgi:hypothetical protein
MKKSFAVLALLSIATIAVKAQNSVLFKIKYLPNEKYTAVMKMNMDMKMAGPPDTTKNKVEAAVGANNTVSMVMSINSVISTGKVNANNSFPMIITSDPGSMTETVNGKTIPIPMGTQTKQIAYATCPVNGNMKIDSVSMSGMKMTDDATKEAISKMIEGIQGKIVFPEKPMTVGDTFTQDTPMNIPMAGNNAPMTVKIIYKLTKIENNNAYFDLAETLDFSINNTQMSMHMMGAGDGKMVYAIDKNYAVDNTNNMTISYSMQMPSMPGGMKGDMKMVTDMATTITAN